MTSNNTCDVNVVFSMNLKDKFFKKSQEYIRQCRTSPFIALRAVKDTFLVTYAQKILEISEAVVVAVNKTKQEIPKKSAVNLERLQRSIFQKRLTEELGKIDLPGDCKKNFLNVLFGETLDFSILSSEEALEKHQDEAEEKAQHESINAWNKFKKSLPNYKEAPRFTNTEQAKWESEINRLREDSEELFKDVDSEDIFVASEYFTYVEKRSKKITFSSYDTNIIQSINTVAKTLQIGCPRAEDLKKGYL